MKLEYGYSIEKEDGIYRLMNGDDVIAEGDSMAAVTKEYVKLAARRKSDVDECLKRIKFKIEVVPDEEKNK